MHKDRIAGIVIALFGAVILFASTKIPVRPNTSDPGSGLFPLLGGTGMFICGLGMIATAKKQSGKPFLGKEEFTRLLKISLVLIIYVISLNYLGFLISSPFMLYALTSLMAYEKRILFWRKAVFAVSITILSWLIFQKIFTILLPTGKLF